MKKLLNILAVILGVCVGVFVVISRMRRYRIESIQVVTAEEIRDSEKLEELAYNERLGEIKVELMSATVEEVIEGFRERFGVKK